MLKLKRKLFLTVFMAVLLAALLPVSAFAQTWSTDDFTVTVPEEFKYMLDQGTSADDPAWALSGVGDPASRLSTYQDMKILVEFRTDGGSSSVVVMKQETDSSQKVYSLKDLTEEERAAFLEGLAQLNEDQEGITLTKEYRDVNGFPFYRMQLDADTEEVKAHDLTCGTVVNGYALTFEMYNGDKEFTPEQLALFDSLIDSVQIINIREKPVQEPVNPAPMLLILFLLFLAVLIPAVYLPLKKRRDKRLKAEMVDRLSGYRRTHPNDSVSGEPVFVNATDCTKEAIHAFSTYQAYIKNVWSLVLGAAVCALILAAAFAMNLVWWLKVLAGGITLFYFYRVFNMPRTVEKIQQKVFQRGVSTVARYSFYDEAFRVSGIQSPALFPYFQITGVRRYRDYLYLYYGPDNAWLVDKDGFEIGEFEDFEKFIREKTEKKGKK